ncbi:glutathione S-transferase family protein [Salinarimonas soli]|uniref:Glutathione S-transferase family protein n=1 Tax=Salinarimonas soli TaxID=1638099 RepID=A0A5B2VAV4_9HYPH|nr:glutathione S-transferase family protein [Salinarimonas soli]KAA2235499.1 glutathione S-transferase family protein [Salinarimonas soli]
MAPFTLYGRTGWGSALVEAQLTRLGLDYDFRPVGDVFKDEAARVALAAVNPLAQVPTLVLPDGAIMTESAAITLHLADLTGRDDLVPGPAAPERAAFLRWLVFLVANIYPTFTYGDEPERFVALEAARRPFREAADAYAERLYRVVEGAAGAPFFLGERFSALDIYVGVMTRWRPKRPWFARNAPRLHAIATRVDAMPDLAGVWARNWPDG